MKQTESLRSLLSREAFAQKQDNPTPLYMQVAGVLRTLIETGRLVPGEALPSERTIAETTALSRVTVRRGIDLLVREGVVRQRRGSGTYVSTPVERFEQPLAAITSFSEDMISYGRQPATRWLAREFASPSAREAMTLGLSPGDRVARLHRLRLADDLPLAVELAIVPARLFSSLETLGDSLYEALAAAGARPHKALQRMHACALPEFEAALLKAEPGEPALYLERVSRTGDGAIVEFTRSHYKGDRFDFVAELNLEPSQNV
ncbi:GntR family transcriptional regulator [Nitratireductor pacificus]|uniref:GntR family transcriptional regulator n=1 Tax=Nitratireductor pacificus pht-3B TaxID=391937 RepID=K2M9A5_9HYPH|nr:GntR family transcriptional regulator [Nitratireductor pacificus]EKF18691.1 GntR family transcriptional regulator [Nitratireductor pacificus pht-3B]